MWLKSVLPDIKTHYRTNIGYKKSTILLHELEISDKREAGIFQNSKTKNDNNTETTSHPP